MSPAFEDRLVAGSSPYARARSTVDLSIVTDATIYLTYNTTSEQGLEGTPMWTSAVPTRVHCRTPGLYLVLCDAMWPTGGVYPDSYRELGITPSNPSYAGVKVGELISSDSSYLVQQVSLVLPMVANEYVRGWAWQNSGGARVVRDASLTLAFLGS